MKVFISYSHTDKENALSLSNLLIRNNFEVLGDFNLKIGDNFEKRLNNSLLEADAIIFLITRAFNLSNYTRQEVITAYSYFTARDKPRILPVLFQDGELPGEFKNMLYLSADNKDSNTIMTELLAHLCIIRDELESEQKGKAENKEIFEESLAKYIEKDLSRLQKKEVLNRFLSYGCYIFSLISIAFAIKLSVDRIQNIDLASDWRNLALSQVTSVFSIILILAMSRLFFVLGKSFMVESIRNSDRIHAISFGEFFLNAYSDVATREEVRDVFGNWNIDNGSSFITQSPKDYDPQLVENLIKALEIFKDQIKK